MEERLIESPWARVREPAEIPWPVTPEALLALSDQQFAALMRDQLLPRRPSQRDRWVAFWEVLGQVDDLAEKAFDVLEQFLDQVSELRRRAGDEDSSGEPVADQELKRATKFETHAEQAWARLQNADRVPDAEVVRRLVFAITRHRALTQEDGLPTDHDEELWRTLSRLGIDPAETSP